jgi:hypothetical protein
MTVLTLMASHDALQIIVVLLHNDFDEAAVCS